jgi:hypothetical protein
MDVVNDQDFSEEIKIGDNMLLQEMLLKELEMADGNQLTWELSVPLIDSEFVRYNGTTLDLIFTRDVLFYEKLSDKVEVEANLHRSFAGKSETQDSVIREYGTHLSDELRQIIHANESLGGPEEKEWVVINLMTTGSVRRSDISTIQCNGVSGGLYRVVISCITSDIVIHLDDVELALLVVTMVECYRDYDSFIDVATNFKLGLLEPNL